MGAFATDDGIAPDPFTAKSERIPANMNGIKALANFWPDPHTVQQLIADYTLVSVLDCDGSEWMMVRNPIE
jgi:hypothetical protein